MKLTTEKLEQIADDAAIRLQPSEVSFYLNELNKIIALFEQIKEVDTAHIEPCFATVHEEDFFEETKELKSLFSDYLMMPKVVLD